MGAGGASASTSGGDSYVKLGNAYLVYAAGGSKGLASAGPNIATCAGAGGCPNTLLAPGQTGFCGGRGGYVVSDYGYGPGGGGAGGYAGVGGAGGNSGDSGTAGTDGSGGGGGGGGGCFGASGLYDCSGVPGGGVGLGGQGASGSGGAVLAIYQGGTPALGYAYQAGGLGGAGSGGNGSLFGGGGGGCVLCYMVHASGADE